MIKFIKTTEQSWWFIIYWNDIPRFCLAWRKDRLIPYIGFPNVLGDPFK